ncbi:MAG: LuxR family transcriptional regulator [Asticcacaulis sp.]
MLVSPHSDVMSFETFVTKTAEARSSEALFDLLTGSMQHFGYDRLIFSVAHDTDLPEDLNRIGLFHHYPEDWQKYYTEKGFERIDPILKAAATHDLPFYWADVERSARISDQQARFMRLGEDAGLNHGIGIPLHGPKSQIAGIALATSHRSNECCRNLDLLFAYCNQFYMAYKRLNARAYGRLNVTLTVKEIEILTRVAAGATDDDIADKLFISRNTVNTHMRHIFEKLEVNNRVTASIKGIMLGLIRP